MSLAFGRDHLAIPGPSVIPSRVLQAMHRPAPNIYHGELVSVVESVLVDLNRVARSGGHGVIYIGNGHAAWEASLVNVFSRGERLLALATGRFGHGWAKMAGELGIEVETLDFGTAAPADPARVTAALAADRRHRIKAVSTVLSDTSTSVRNDIAAIRAAIDAAGHPALLMVDAICSFACEPFDMDACGVDVMVTGCQKGLMTPPGLAFNFVGERALAAHRDADLKTPYWRWDSRIEPETFPMRFCGTPPTHHLYGLRAALDMLLEEGVEHVWRRHRVLAEAVWAAIDAWSTEGDIACHLVARDARSLAVTAVRTGGGDAPRLREWCEREAGVVLGIGFDLRPDGPAPTSTFRIGHMGHLNPPMLLGTLGTIEAGLRALDIAHGPGALAAASEVIARGTAGA